jgi:cell wall-associated NlpC family hydrolase
MTWDATSQQQAMVVIGTVESQLKYDSVNIADPITIGIAQWYGNRAAALLDRMKTENPSSWSGVTPSLENYIDTYPSSDPVWNTLYLDTADADSIKPILTANASIQNDQFKTDIIAYATVAANQGMDVNANTNSLIFWEVMYHQNPREALAVMAAAGPNASLDRYYSMALNDTIFGQYPDRYKTAYDMILNGTSTGITDTPPPPTTQTPSGNTGGSTGATQALSPVAVITKVGDHLQVQGPNGSFMAYSNGNGRYIAGTASNPAAPTVVQPPPTTPTDPPTGGTSPGDALVAWAATEADKFAYGQGAGRLSPLLPGGGNESGYTDCSGFCYYAYMAVLGMNIGTWGGDQIKNGTLVATGGSTIDTSSLQTGDLIFYEWSGGDPVNYDHTAMYAGNGMVWSHGGGQGPNLIHIVGDYVGVTPVAIMARRYL